MEAANHHHPITQFQQKAHPSNRQSLHMPEMEVMSFSLVTTEVSFSCYRTKQSVMVYGPTIQPFAPVTVHVLELINASVMTDGPGMTVRLHIALTSKPMTSPFARVTVFVLVLTSASVTVDGWDWIVRSLIALVSHQMSQMLSVLARASVSVTTTVDVLMDSVDTSARDLQYQNKLVSQVCGFVEE